MKHSNRILEQEAQQIEEAIVEEIESIQENVWRRVKLGFSIALIAIGTFWIVRKWLNYPLRLQDFLPKSHTSEGSSQHSSSTIVPSCENSTQEWELLSMIKREIALFLLSIAKQKIYELLAKLESYKNEPIQNK